MKQSQLIILFVLLVMPMAYAAQEKSQPHYYVLPSPEVPQPAPMPVERAQAVEDKIKILTAIEDSMTRSHVAPIDYLYVLKVPEHDINELRRLMESYNNQKGSPKIPDDSKQLKKLIHKLKKQDWVVDQSADAGLTTKMQHPKSLFKNRAEPAHQYARKSNSSD